ncbi:hypothetical protein [Streptomyces vinaceus]|uniref:hypothetical protein n=1 Tax=Streptomyces vinaceus TaxID=1960 RepID=UPI00368A1E77
MPRAASVRAHGLGEEDMCAGDVAVLLERQRLQRPDRGEVPTLGRADIVVYSNRMGHITATDKQSVSRWPAYTRFVRRVLFRFRTLGLAGLGGLLEGMPVDFGILCSATVNVKWAYRPGR